ncbi:hypothetical protein [Nocardia vaccinii]|uniref:hypothetical protein n=1 Tax=Nocardia vaccinii TaxID=1822 RepID=UPI0012F4A27C|nr:hypothetical protein [Nocardia vaccinii]
MQLLAAAQSPDPFSQLAIQIVDLLVQLPAAGGHRPRELGDQTVESGQSLREIVDDAVAAESSGGNLPTRVEFVQMPAQAIDQFGALGDQNVTGKLLERKVSAQGCVRAIPRFTAPIPAWSGHTSDKVRLNRAGNRFLPLRAGSFAIPVIPLKGRVLRRTHNPAQMNSTPHTSPPASRRPWCSVTNFAKRAGWSISAMLLCPGSCRQNVGF